VPHWIIMSLLAIWPVELVVVLSAICVALLRPVRDDDPPLGTAEPRTVGDATSAAESSGTHRTASARG
jgi:hypothetical protein